jgi:hypothetical protein
MLLEHAFISVNRESLAIERAEQNAANGVNEPIGMM